MVALIGMVADSPDISLFGGLKAACSAALMSGIRRAGFGVYFGVLAPWSDGKK
jgi:hypothetical protein